MNIVAARSYSYTYYYATRIAGRGSGCMRV